VANFLILMKLGACHVETPYIELGQVCTVLYFSYFIIIVPVVSLIENSITGGGSGNFFFKGGGNIIPSIQVESSRIHLYNS